MKNSVIIFSSKDDLNAGWERAVKLVEEAKKFHVDIKLVNKTGFVLEDLHLVARYHVVSTPTVLVLRGEDVVYRKLRLPNALALAEYIDILNYEPPTPAPVKL